MLMFGLDLKPIYKIVYVKRVYENKIRKLPKNEIDSIKCHPIDNDNPNIKPWFELIKTPDLNGKNYFWSLVLTHGSPK